MYTVWRENCGSFIGKLCLTVLITSNFVNAITMSVAEPLPWGICVLRIRLDVNELFASERKHF